MIFASARPSHYREEEYGMTEKILPVVKYVPLSLWDYWRYLPFYYNMLAQWFSSYLGSLHPNLARLPLSHAIQHLAWLLFFLKTSGLYFVM